MMAYNKYFHSYSASNLQTLRVFNVQTKDITYRLKTMNRNGKFNFILKFNYGYKYEPRTSFRLWYS